MSQFPHSVARTRESIEISERDRAVIRFFNTVYAWLAVGLTLTAITAYVTATTDSLFQAVYSSPGMIAGIGVLCLLISLGVQWTAGRLNSTVALLLYLIYATGLGVLCSYVFVVYSMKTIGAAFLLTAGIFAAMSVYGFVTKKDLSSMGSLLFMALIGVILASIVNIFVANSIVSWIITYAVLGIFIGFTAYDTQQLRRAAYATADYPEMANRYAIVGSLLLYICFINILLSLLRILGEQE
jgi:FtsH-binding integral membrane protein